MNVSTKTATKALLFALTLGAAVGVTGQAQAAPETHDGFYMQLGVGLGYLSSTATVGAYDYTLKGLTIPTEILLGGTLFPGFVLGGGITNDYAPSPSASIDGPAGSASGDLEDVKLFLVGIEMFADYYFDEHKGMHLQALVGYSALESSYKGNAGGSDPTGLIIAPGFGYDWWVGNEWSVGVLGRLSYAPLSLDGVGYSTIAPAVLATFTYH